MRAAGARPIGHDARAGQQQQRERDEVGDHAGEDEQQAREHRARAVDERGDGEAALRRGAAARRATSAKRASLMSAMPAQAASTHPGEHPPAMAVSPRRTSTTASSRGKPSKIAISTSRIHDLHLRFQQRRAGAPHVAVIAVLTNLPDSESAFNLARELVRLRLAACANVLAPATSFYRWEGREEQATEHPGAHQVHPRALPRARSARSASRHPYVVPEIIAWPIERGSPTTSTGSNASPTMT